MGAISNTHIAFIGGGTMAEAIIRGLIDKDLCPPRLILASDPIEARRTYLADELGIRVSDSNASAVADAQIVVLAVKPQVLSKVLDDLSGQIRPDTLMLSIVAGAKIERIRDALGTKAVTRVMPNTPGQVGEGISVWTTTPETAALEREQAREIIGALGQEIYVEEEGYLNMATALSGSGPAYVFLFIEALTDAGVRMGFARPIAEKLALQTVRGSAIYAQKTALHPAILRNRVTSPGGTTAAALHELERGGFRALVSDAIWAAYQRAEYIGELKKQ